MFIDLITKKPVKVIALGPTPRTVVIQHQDGSRQVQFKSLLKWKN